MYIGLDVGFGFTKMTNGEEKYIFPSLVTKNVSSEKTFTEENDIVTVNGTEYVVGHNVPSASSVSKDFVGSDHYFALIGYSLSKISATIPIEGIGLGIPPGVYNHNKIKNIKDAFQTVRIKCGKRPIFLPTKIEFIPQGVGAYIKWVHENPSGKNINTVVVDIGYYTVDVVYIDKGKFISDFSKSFPFGVETLLERLKDKFVTKYGEFITTRAAEELLINGKITHFGKEYSIDTEKNFLINNFYIEELVRIIKNYSISIKDAGYIVQNVVVCGGGAQYLPKVSGATVISNPQFANAEGYKMYVERTK